MPPNRGPDSSSTNPLQTIREAMKAVPAVRYALGVVGVAAAASLIRAYFSSTQLAVYATVALLGLMVLLWGFAHLAGVPAKWLRYPASVLAWVIFVALASLPILLVSSVFFNWPKPFPELRTMFMATDSRISVPPTSEADARFAGFLTDAQTGQGIGGVKVRVAANGPVVATSGSDGFYEFSLTDASKTRVTVTYQANGYETITESVYPSDGLNFSLRQSRKRF
jgi:hypothetical protein